MIVDRPLPLLHLDAHAAQTALALLRDQLGQRLWPLHRLDKATSGVLLFARDARQSSVAALKGACTFSSPPRNRSATTGAMSS